MASKPNAPSHVPCDGHGGASCSGPLRWSCDSNMLKIRSSGPLGTGQMQVRPGLAKKRWPTKLPTAEPTI